MKVGEAIQVAGVKRAKHEPFSEQRRQHARSLRAQTTRVRACAALYVRKDVSLMNATDQTSRAEIGVIYFHGAAPVRDLGPDEATVQNSGVVVVRHVRPGYDNTNPRSGESLCEVASQALDEALAMGLQSIVAVGWSGGGTVCSRCRIAGSKGVAWCRRHSLAGANGSATPCAAARRRVFMRIAHRFPLPVLRLALAVVGRRNPGHVDIHRVARSWGFTPAEVTSRVPVAAWHSVCDAEVPIGRGRICRKSASADL